MMIKGLINARLKLCKLKKTDAKSKRIRFFYDSKVVILILFFRALFIV